MFKSHTKISFIGIWIFSIIVSFYTSSTAFAETASENSGANFKVTVERISALEIKVPSEIILNLTLTKDNSAFGSADVNILVSTTNEAGYTLTMTPSSTELSRTEEINGVIPTIKNLTFGSYTEENFINNSWGYKVTSSNIDDIVTPNYVPVPTTKELNKTSEAAMQDKTTLTFASKVGTETPAGSYKTTLHFIATANPLIIYIQDLTKDQCRVLAINDDYTVLDQRDNNEYTVRYINDNCWMTQNLRIAGGTKLTPGDSDVLNVYYIPMTEQNTNLSYTTGLIRTPTSADAAAADLTVEQIGMWYNFCAATAGTVCDNSTVAPAEHSICPKNWHLPTVAEFSSIIDYQSEFSPVYGGVVDSKPEEPTNFGFWWAPTAAGWKPNVIRQSLAYRNGALGIDSSHGRDWAHYVRCVRTK